MVRVLFHGDKDASDRAGFTLGQVDLLRRDTQCPATDASSWPVASIRRSDTARFAR